MDLFTRLATRALEQKPAIAPVVPSLFAPVTDTLAGTDTFEQTEPLVEPTVRLTDTAIAAPAEAPRVNRVAPDERSRPEPVRPRTPAPIAEPVRSSTIETPMARPSATAPRVPPMQRDDPPNRNREQTPAPAVPPSNRSRPTTPPPITSVARERPADAHEPVPPTAPPREVEPPSPAATRPPTPRPVVEPVARHDEPVLNLPATPPSPAREKTAAPSRGQPAEPTRAAMRAAMGPPPPEPATPSVHVHIGRVDVRAIMSTPPATPVRREPAAPKLTLEEYLGSKNEARR